MVVRSIIRSYHSTDSQLSDLVDEPSFWFEHELPAKMDSVMRVQVLKDYRNKSDRFTAERFMLTLGQNYLHVWHQ